MLPQGSHRKTKGQAIQGIDRVRLRSEDLKAARAGSVLGSNAASDLEESHWLCPIEDRRGRDSLREGMVEGFSLGSYFLLVDDTSR